MVMMCTKKQTEKKKKQPYHHFTLNSLVHGLHPLIRGHPQSIACPVYVLWNVNNKDVDLVGDGEVDVLVLVMLVPDIPELLDLLLPALLGPFSTDQGPHFLDEVQDHNQLLILWGNYLIEERGVLKNSSYSISIIPLVVKGVADASELLSDHGNLWNQLIKLPKDQVWWTKVQHMKPKGGHMVHDEILIL